MRLHGTKKALHTQGKGHQTEEIAHRMVENVCHIFIGQGINNQNLQGVKKLTSQRINDVMKK
jgi:hypothetical protein